MKSDLQNGRGEIMKLAIFPEGTTRESYLFEIEEGGVLQSYMGTRKNDDIIRKKFYSKIEENQEKILEHDELEKLIMMAEKIKTNNDLLEKPIVFDAWNIILLYDGQIYKAIYDSSTGDLREIVDEFIRISPLQVDLHGWS